MKSEKHTLCVKEELNMAMVVDKSGKIFDDRRKESHDRRKKNVKVEDDRRKANRREDKK